LSVELDATLGDLAERVARAHAKLAREGYRPADLRLSSSNPMGTASTKCPTERNLPSGT
jgi:hypothetical protein